MLEQFVADGGDTLRIGSAIGAFLFPILGALLLVIGVRRRIAHNRWHQRDDERLLAASPNVPDLTPLPASRGAGLIVAGVVLLLLGALHLVGWIGDRLKSRGIEVGQCITADTDAEGRLSIDPVECDRRDATFLLVSQGDGSATCPENPFPRTRYIPLVNESRTLCFALNLQPGECYHVGRQVRPVLCTDPAANVLVAERIDGTTNGAVCGADAWRDLGDEVEAMVYRDPPRTYCLVTPR